MRAAWAMGMVIGIVACHKAPEVEPWPTREVGEYSFRLTATPVSGKFTILPDTVTVEAQEQSCRRIGTEMRDQLVHPFRCVGGSTAFNVMLNSRSPWLSTWRTVTRVTKTVEICTQYKITGGQRSCASSRTEVRADSVLSSGRLDVTRIASAEKP